MTAIADFHTVESGLEFDNNDGFDALRRLQSTHNALLEALEGLASMVKHEHEGAPDNLTWGGPLMHACAAIAQAKGDA